MEFHFEIISLQCVEMEFHFEIVSSQCVKMKFHFEIISLQCIKSVFRLRREKMSDESGSRVCSGAFPFHKSRNTFFAVVFDFFKHNLESDSGSYRKFFGLNVVQVCEFLLYLHHIE